MSTLTLDWLKHRGSTWVPKSSLNSRHQASRILCLFGLQHLDFHTKFKYYFNLKPGLWTAEQQIFFFLIGPGKRFLVLAGSELANHKNYESSSPGPAHTCVWLFFTLFLLGGFNHTFSFHSTFQ